MSPVHVELVEAGVRGAASSAAGGCGTPVDALQAGLRLRRDQGAAVGRAGILQVVHGRQRGGPAEQLRGTSVSAQVGQPRHQLTICRPRLLSVACLHPVHGFKRKRGVRLRRGRPSSSGLSSSRLSCGGSGDSSCLVPEEL